MDTIARIPHLTPATPHQAGPQDCPPPVVPRPRPRFPAPSAATLAVIAAVLWTLATWHEQQRLARQRRPDRLALEPPPVALESQTP